MRGSLDFGAAEDVSLAELRARKEASGGRPSVAARPADLPPSPAASLVQAAQAGLYVLLLSSLLFGLADLALTEADRLELYSLRLAQVGVVTAALWLLPLLRTEEQVHRLVLLVGAVMSVLIAALGWVVGDPQRVVVMCLMIVWGTAALIPWRAAEQIQLALLSGGALLANLWASGGELSTVASFPAIATGLGLAVSPALTYQFERQRRAIAEESSQRQLAQSGWRQSEAELRAIFDNLEDVFFRVTLDGIVQMISPSVARYGYTVEELLGTRATLFYAEPRVREENLALLMRQGVLRDVELTLVTKDGRHIPMSENVHLCFDAQGKPIAVEGMLRDITDRKRNEETLRRAREDLEQRVIERTETLRQSEELFRSAFERGPIGIAVVDRDLRTIKANAALCEMLGYSEAELRQVSIADLTHPEDLATELPWVEAILAGTRDGYELDKRYHTRTGQVVWAHLRLGVLRDREGAPLYGVGVIENISERKRMEDALQSAHQHLSHVLAASPVMLYSLPIRQGEPTPAWISENFTRLTGYSGNEQGGPAWWAERVHPDDLNRLESFGDVLAHDHAVQEYRFRRADGSYMWIRNESRVMRDASGQPVEMIGSWADITERKRIEDAAQRAQEQLGRVLSLSPVVIYSLKLDGERVISVWNSDNITRVTGYPREETLSMEWWLERIHPDDLPRLDLASTLERDTLLREFRFLYADGSYAWIRDEARVVRDVKGAAVGIVGAWADVTEQKRSQDAAQRGERRFRALIEKSRDMVSILDRDGAYRYVNPVHEAFFGCEASALLGANALGRVHPDDARALVPLLADAIRDDLSSLAVEYRLRHKDGSWHAFDGIALNLLDDPDVGGILVSGRDVTERKRAEERTALLLEFSQDMRAAHDLGELLERTQQRTARVLACDGVVTFYWQAKEQIFRAIGDYGLRAEWRADVHALAFRIDEPFGGRLSGGETLVFNDFKDGPAAVTAVAERLGFGAMIVAPLRVQDRHLGSLVAIRSRGEPFDPNLADLCTGIAGQLAVAIEALQLHQHQREEATISAALARVGQELISWLDSTELTERLCAVTAEVLGCDVSYTIVRLPEEEAYGIAAAHGTREEEWESVRLLKLPPEAVAGMLDALRQDEILQVDTAAPPTPWAALPARYGIGTVLYAPLRRGDEVVGFHAAGFRGAERQFSPQQERIARGIAELASVGLENARLVQQLEQASRLKSEFLATMSHELRTPLNVITGYTELMLEEAFGKVSTEQTDTLRRVHMNACGLLDLINATLDMSRLESGRLPMSWSQIILPELMAEIEAEMRGLQDQTGLRFSWQLAPDLPAIRTDGVKLKVVLKNLLSNAVKFTEQGVITVEVASDGDGVAIVVADSGIGISPEVLPFIFEPFRQGDSSFTRRHGGVGLGLYIVRRLLDLLGGKISVDSELRRGSMFRVWLPTDGGRTSR